MLAMDQVDCVVIGAGVVGLAVARELAQAGLEVVILEADRAIGMATSSRNSEVIHAGIYYPPGSLKARLCVQGRGLLYDYCQTRGVGHLRCGKLIVAADATQLGALEALHANAAACGVSDLCWLEYRDIIALEPQIRAHAALLSTSTGIVDSHALMLSLLGDAELHGAVLACNTRVVRGVAAAGAIELEVLSGGQSSWLRAPRVINSAGLHAVNVAQSIQGLDPSRLPPRYLAKGSYFSCTARGGFSHLVYPVPEPGGLGVHLTLDLGGQIRFGPDVNWVDGIDYTVCANDAGRFEDAIRRYWPSLPDGALQPSYAGIRPKISGPGQPAADFRIDGPTAHGITGLVNLFGIESPGLTASLAIATMVAGLLGATAQ